MVLLSAGLGVKSHHRAPEGRDSFLRGGKVTVVKGPPLLLSPHAFRGSGYEGGSPREMFMLP
jgi:hypothetical protein